MTAEAQITIRPRVERKRNQFREWVSIPYYELKCPKCGKWRGLSDMMYQGTEPFTCPSLGCDFVVTNNFSEWAKEANATRSHSSARGDERVRGHARGAKPSSSEWP